MRTTYQVCQIPNCHRPCQVGHHIFGKKAYPAGRYLLINAFGSCNGHHRFLCHDDPEKFRDIVITWMRPWKYEDVKQYLGTARLDFTLGEYLVLEGYLKDILAKLKAGKIVDSAVVSCMVEEPKILKALVMPKLTNGLSPEEMAAIQKTAIYYAGKGGNDAEEVE